MKRGTLIAVGLFAVLLIVWLATRETQVSVGIKKLEVASIDKTKITEIDASGAKSFVLKHDASGWKVEDPAHPGQHLADDAQITNLIDGFAETKYGDLVTDRKDKHAEYEVDDAKGLRVKIVPEGGAPVELVFGKSARGGSYVRKSDGTDVFLATGRFPFAARRDANTWRKHQILSLKQDELTSVTLHPKDAEAYTLEKGADNAWKLKDGTATPAGFRFDAAAAGRIPQQLASLSAQDFLDVSAPDAVLAFSETVEATMKDGKTVVVHLGQPVQAPADGGAVEAGAANAPFALRVDGDPQVYLVNSYLKGELTKPLTNLRDFSLMSFDASKAKRLSIHGANPVVVEKDGATWKVTEPKTLPAGAEFEPTQVMNQLTRVRNLKAAHVIEPAVAEAKAGLDKDWVEVTLEDGKKQTVRFGKEIPGGATKEIYVKGAADGAVYAIAPGFKAQFDSGLALFKKPPPMPNFGAGGAGGIKGLENLPPDVRRQLEAQLGQRMGGGHP